MAMKIEGEAEHSGERVLRVRSNPSDLPADISREQWICRARLVHPGTEAVDFSMALKANIHHIELAVFFETFEPHKVTLGHNAYRLLIDHVAAVLDDLERFA